MHKWNLIFLSFFGIEYDVRKHNPENHGILISYPISLSNYAPNTFLLRNFFASPVGTTQAAHFCATTVFFESKTFMGELTMSVFRPTDFRLVLWIDPCASVCHFVRLCVHVFSIFYKTALMIFPIFCKSVEDNRAHFLS